MELFPSATRRELKNRAIGKLREMRKNCSHGLKETLDVIYDHHLDVVRYTKYRGCELCGFRLAFQTATMSRKMAKSYCSKLKWRTQNNGSISFSD